jgi:hypothetical protein
MLPRPRGILRGDDCSVNHYSLSLPTRASPAITIEQLPTAARALRCPYRDRRSGRVRIVSARKASAAQRKRYEEVKQAERLRQSLDRHWAEAEAGVVERGVRIDPEIADRLRAMGYLR